MSRFDIEVTFRKKGAFTERNSDGPITGELHINTKRCHVEPILASMNVDSYRICGSSERYQVMAVGKKIPGFYYGEDAVEERR